MVEVGVVRVPGARLHVERQGAGPLLLLVVGGSGDPAAFAGVARPLAARHTVVSWARRGFVRSPLDAAPPDTAGRIAADVADAAALVRAHSSGHHPSGHHDGRADVFGSSSGAIVALELVARHPELVRRAVIHEPPVLELLDDPQEWRDRFAAIDATHRDQGVEPAFAAFVEAVGLQALTRPRTGPEAADLAPLRERTPANRAFWFAHEFVQYPAWHLDLDALAAVADRIVLAVGRDSRERGLMPALPNLVLGRLLGRPVVELPGGHVGYAEHPEAFAAALERLL